MNKWIYEPHVIFILTKAYLIILLFTNLNWCDGTFSWCIQQRGRQWFELYTRITLSRIFSRVTPSGFLRCKVGESFARHSKCVRNSRIFLHHPTYTQLYVSPSIFLCPTWVSWSYFICCLMLGPWETLCFTPYCSKTPENGGKMESRMQKNGGKWKFTSNKMARNLK